MDYLTQKVQNILDEDLLQCLKDNGGYIAGGCMTSLVTNKEINDYDVYFRDSNALFEAVQTMKDSGYHLAYISDKSLSFIDSAGETYQFIYYNYYESAEDIFDEFDWTINMCAYDCTSESLVMHDDFLLHNSQRYLSFNPGTRFPLLSSLRVQKYKERGYYISKTEYIKVMLSVMNLNIETWDEFRNHMGGLYGFNYINKEQLKEVTDKEFTIEGALELLGNIEITETREKDLIYPYDLVEYVVSGKPLEVYKRGSDEYDPVDVSVCGTTISELVESGVLNIKVVSRKEAIGEYVYKWVTNDLRSFYRKEFQYELGKRVEPWYGLKMMNHYDGKLYMHKYDQVKRSMFKQDKILVCEYDEEDIISESHDKIMMEAVTPVMVFDNFESLKKFMDSQE